MAKIAVVTGASSGIGKQFAVQLAKRPEVEEVWALARNIEKLKELTLEIEKTVRVFSVDVSDNAQVNKFFQVVEKEQPEIIWLANNAGWGKFCRYDDLTPEESISMINTNCSGVVNIALRSLVYMPKGAHIINTSSASAFLPLPYIGLYAATKSFVRSFSRSMNKEMRGKRVTVTCMCPYWVNTNFFDNAQKHQGDIVITKFEVMYKADDVVRKALDDAEKGKDMSVYGWINQAQHIMSKILPQRFSMWVFLKKQGLK